ncbi:unnamed protein product [Brassica napus]|uniref:(rape) hypothetical protein n=1 Tax=Brassica napus TaxID=3708 RepID=A0A816KUR7_BRANA|nr:unnamed protein product [Brassica napus]
MARHLILLLTISSYNFKIKTSCWRKIAIINENCWCLSIFAGLDFKLSKESCSSRCQRSSCHPIL